MTDKKQAKERAAKLRQAIDEYRYQHHVLDALEIPESALDSLKHELWKIEQEFPELVTPDSPTQRVAGQAGDAFRKVPHAAPMLSLEDVFSYDELAAWFERAARRVPGLHPEFYAEVKMDGLAVSLEYQGGRFAVGSTRGDGRTGEDITQNLRTIESIPLVLRRPAERELQAFVKEFGHDGLSAVGLARIVERLLEGRTEIRGEVYMPKKSFERLNAGAAKRGEPVFANPRNAAAGSLRQLDPSMAASRGLAFFAYDLVTRTGLETHEQGHELARLLGFPVNPHNARCAGLERVEALYRAIGKKRERLPYWIDGVVVGINQNAAFERLGTVGKTPRGMVAYKFPAEAVTTVVREVRWQVGRTGAVTPVAVMDPVQVAGTTVRHATLHNLDEIARLGVKLGDTVVLEKAGDVIPKILRVLPELRSGKEKPIRPPEACPVCGTRLIRRDGEVALVCANPECDAKDLARLIHFASKRGLDIDGLGEKIVEQLVEADLVSQPADFFELTAGDIEPLEGFAEKSAANLVEAIRRSRRVPLARLLVALGIRHVGEETASALAEAFGTLKSLRAASRDDLLAIHGLGETVAESVTEYFSDPRRSREIDRLEEAGLHVESAERRSDGPLKGSTFVLTGTLSSLSRDEAKERVRALGGHVASSVSKETSYVVVGEDPGSKAAKAEKLGLKILDEKNFLDLLKKRT